jgi:riboflavin synthase
MAHWVAEKGSVTLDGVSLTVAKLDGETFSVALIPHTLEVTTLGDKEVGARLNLEVDILAKYLQRLVERGGLGVAST